MQAQYNSKMILALFMIVQAVQPAASEISSKNLLTAACEEIITCPHVPAKPVIHGVCLQRHLLQSFEQGDFSTSVQLFCIALHMLKRATDDAAVPLAAVFQEFFLHHAQKYCMARALHEILSISCDVVMMECMTTGCDNYQLVERKAYYCDRKNSAILFRIAYDAERYTLVFEPHLSCPQKGALWYKRLFMLHAHHYFAKHGDTYKFDLSVLPQLF